MIISFCFSSGSKFLIAEQIEGSMSKSSLIFKAPTVVASFQEIMILSKSESETKQSIKQDFLLPNLSV